MILFALIVLLGLTLSFLWWNKRTTIDMSELKKSISDVLDYGCVVERNSYHLYKAKVKPDRFIILHFDDNANLEDEERQFDDREQAILTFIQDAAPKKEAA